MSEMLSNMPNDDEHMIGWYNDETGNWDKEQPDLPVLPYGGTSGWSGTDTSRERAERDDTSGTTAKRQIETMSLARQRAVHGITVKDLRERMDWHHGQASSVLSSLHKEGRLVRLAEKRDRCHVYVMPDWIIGREVQKYGRNKRDAGTLKLAAIRSIAAEWAEGLCTYSPLCRHCGARRIIGIIDEEEKDG